MRLCLKGSALFATLLLASFFYTSCKKVDFKSASSQTTFSTIQDRFFGGRSQDPRVNSVKDKIFHEEQAKPFVTSYVQWAGFPHWDKALVSKSANATMRGAGGSLDYTVVYVPFTKDSNNTVGAILVAYITPRDTFLKTIYAWQYKQLPYKTSATTGRTAEEMALFFMAFEHYAFGRSMFQIADTSLFRNDYANERTLFYSPENLTIGRDGLSIQICGDVFVPTTGYNDGSEPDSQPDWGHNHYQCSDFPIGGDGDNPFLDTGGGGTGFPGTVGSGTGGGGGWNDNPCRNIAAAGGSNPCDGGGTTTPGWEPFTNSLTFIEGWMNGQPIFSGGILGQYYNTNQQFWDQQEAALTNPNTHPFTTDGLRTLGQNRGWDVGISAVSFNKKMGKAFEESALLYYGLTENLSDFPAPRRAAANYPNQPTAVRPDGLDPFQVIWHDQGGNTHFAQLENIFGTEIKAYTGTLELSTSKWQILGELELLRNNFDQQIAQPYWQQLNPPLTINSVKAGPILFFITTSNTEIGQSIIDEAARLGITLWQAKSVWNVVDSKMSFDDIRFIYDKAGTYNKGDIVPGALIHSFLQGAVGMQVPLQISLFPRPNFTTDPEDLE